MPKTRVLIVDDSVVIRRSLVEALSRNPGLDVVGSAPNGRTALMKLPLLHPDVVVLDVDMPGMGGIETLASLRKASPDVPVIMLSVPTEQGAAATIEALALGAKDYVIKPEGAGTMGDGMGALGSELTDRIDQLSVRGHNERAASDSDVNAPANPTPVAIQAGHAAARVDALAIGVSTGGPNALMHLLPGFPADFPVPILIVQHMPPLFTSLLAGRLAKNCRIPVAEGRPNQTIHGGGAWIAPGDFHMTVERDGGAVRIRTQRGRPENSCRPAVDVLFRSVAKVYGPHAVGVIMTGMGEDGFRGCQHIRAAGGQVLVQDEASSVVWGMPGAVVRAGVADQIVSLHDLPGEINKRVWSHRAKRRAPASE